MKTHHCVYFRTEGVIISLSLYIYIHTHTRFHPSTVAVGWVRCCRRGAIRRCRPRRPKQRLDADEVVKRRRPWRRIWSLPIYRSVLTGDLAWPTPPDSHHLPRFVIVLFLVFTYERGEAAAIWSGEGEDLDLVPPPNPCHRTLVIPCSRVADLVVSRS